MPQEPEEEESTEARFRRVQEELRAMELPEMPDEAVDERLREIQGQGRMSMPDVPLGEDLLRDLENRTTRARVSHQRAKGGDPSNLARDQKAAKGLGIGIAIAYTILGLPLLGLAVGYFVNRASPGPWIPIGVTVGFVGGIAFAIYLNGREGSRL